MKSEARKTFQRDKPNRVLIKNLVFLVIWITLFTLAYAQSPLYTSNQNQYFLHGLANAGFGNLREDWLANTLDPTPVFSKLIEISWRILPWQPIFYLYFGILAGILLYSLLGIVNTLWRLANSPPQKWFFLTALIVLFSAGLRYLSARFWGIEWEFLFDSGVAGQRLLGTVFQPSTFGVFLILSINLFLREKQGWAIVCLLVATTFHPTYLLSAGVLTAIYMGITYWESRQVRFALALGLGALIGVFPILWHTLNTFGGTSQKMTNEARKILMEFRIPHHAVVFEWFDASVLVKIGFVGLALIILYASQKQLRTNSEVILTSPAKLFHIILWPSIVALSLTIVQVLTGNVVLALVFPWRLSSWLVPLSVGLTAGWTVQWSFEHFQLERHSKWIIFLSWIITIVFAIIGVSKFQISRQQQQTLDDRAMMAYVAANNQPGEAYLIPLKMQDFRLETGAPAYVEFKSIPYKDEDVLEWRRRVDFVGKFNNRNRCRKISEWGEEEGFTHLVLSKGHPARQCKKNLERVYNDKFYGVYKIIEER